MNLVLLTGAGISAESGIRTFRGESAAGPGLWEGERLEDIATPEAFARDPDRVHRFYDERRAQLADPKLRPNLAHFALARLERAWREEKRGDFLLVTQNVDDLHARAGSRAMIALHGQLRRVRCRVTDEVFPWEAPLGRGAECPLCLKPGHLRPHIVWFGEEPLELPRIFAALESADVFAAIGTSGLVYPAAGFVEAAPRGCRRIELNAEDTPVSDAFQEHRRGPATREVTAWVDELLSAPA